MTFAQTRLDVADALTVALGTTVYPYLPTPLKAGSGWLVFKRADTEDCTLGDFRVTYDVVVAIGTDLQAAQGQLDELSAPLLSACSRIGLGVSVEPLALSIDGQDFLCAVATLITETEA